MKTVTTAVLTALMFTTGCATDVANRYYGEKKFAPRPFDQVAVLWQKPERPFVIIADFQSRGESPTDLQKKAAEIGADAVIVAILGGYYNRSEQWAGQDRNSDSYSRIVGTAIKYE